jgi:hypothetical protein
MHSALLQKPTGVTETEQKAFWGLSAASITPKEDKLWLTEDRQTLFETAGPLHFELPLYNETRGCDALRFEIFSHTRFSGIPEIDKQESQHVQRVITAGTLVLDLLTIFEAYRKQPQQEYVLIKDVMYDQHSIEDKARAMIGERDISEQEYDALLLRSRELTQKGTVLFRVRINNFNQAVFQKSILAVPQLTERYGVSYPLQKYRLDCEKHTEPLSEEEARKKKEAEDRAAAVLQQQRHYKDFSPLLYNSQQAWSQMMSTMNGVLTQYCNNFVQLSQDHTPRYVPHEAIYKHLQLMQYVSKQGRMPVYAYWADEPFFREYPTLQAQKDALALYGFNADTELYFHKLLLASLRRHGLSEKQFVQAVNGHYSAQNTQTTIAPDFLVAEEAMADIGTFAANTAYYTSDLRYVPVQDSVNGADHTHNSREEHIHCRRCGKRMEMQMITTDSWDNDILDGTSMCDDCEGQDKTATTILRSFGIGRYDLGFRWQTASLQAVQKHLQYTCIMDVGSLVGAPYVDPNAPRATETPVIGGQTDRKTNCDGHCFALKLALSRVTEWLARGKTVPEEILAKMRAATWISASFAKRDAQRQCLVLEGTGSVEPRILSLAESYGQDSVLYQKKLSEQVFLKTLRKDMQKQLKEGESLFCGEGLCFYAKKQDCTRRVSNFYHSVVHGTSIELMRRFGLGLSQMAFARRVSENFEYGVRMGELIRDDQQSMVLLCPFTGCEEEWRRSVVPMVETIQNQMQISSFGRYTQEQYRDDIYSFYVPKTEITRCRAEAPKQNKPQPQAQAQAQQKFESLLERVGTDSSLALVRLYSRQWKMTESAERTEALKKLLQKTPGLVDYGFYMEKPLSVCEPVLLILCVVDVTRSLASAESK